MSRIVYILERFPSDTLNFVYNEIRGLEASGLEVEIHSLLPGRLCPEEAADFEGRTRTVRPVGVSRLLRALGHYLLRRPVALLGLFLVLPFDNRNGVVGKGIKTVVHLVYAVYFAYLVRDHSGHVHAHFAFKAALCGLVASRLNGQTFSFTAHGSATVYPPSRYVLRSKIRGARFVVAVSDFNRRTMLDLCPEYPADRIIVNRTGVRLPEFPFEPGGARADGVLRIVCVATLYPIKNHAGLVEACGELHRRGVEFHLDLVGKDDAGLGASLRERAKVLGIADRITFHGSVDHGRIADFLGRSDVCILSSFSEGIPVSLMEAMARGTSVIGPRVTGVPELIEDGRTGWLVDPHDPASIADALEAAAADPARRAGMVRQAREHIEKEYDMDANARRLAAHFEAFLGGRTGDDA